MRAVGATVTDGWTGITLYHSERETTDSKVSELAKPLDATWEGGDEELNASVLAEAAKELGHCANPDDIPRMEQYTDSHDVLRLMSAATLVRLSLIQQVQTASPSAGRPRSALTS
jgi:hypothetical protein